jgi:ribose transport system permease protein
MRNGRVSLRGRTGHADGAGEGAGRAADSAELRRWLDLRWRLAPLVFIWAATIVLLALTAIIFPSTFRFGSLATLTPLIGVLVIASLGQSLVIGTGGIDLSVSSVITLVGVVFVQVSDHQDGAVPKALALALLTGLVCGLVNGLVVEYRRLNPLVVTLATGQIMLGLASVWSGGGTSNPPVPPDWRDLTGRNLGGVSYILFAGVLLALVLSATLSGTAGGRRLGAASTSIRASRYQGTKVLRYRAGTYAVAGVVYGLAGTLLAGVLNTPTLSLGAPYQLATIVAVVLGGAALSGGRLHPGATLAGAVFLAVTNQDVATYGLAVGAQSVVQGVVLIVAMLAVGLGGLRRLRMRRLRGDLRTRAGRRPEPPAAPAG